MKRILFTTSTVIAAVLLINTPLANAQVQNLSRFHSTAGDEYVVRFQGVFRSQEHDPRVFQRSLQARKSFIEKQIVPTMDFLFGPLTHRVLGNPQRVHSIDVAWDQLKVVGNRVELPYRYQGTWIVSQRVAKAGGVDIPVPFSREDVQTRGWKGCGDSDPDHQTPSFYWYFWDPKRFTCDQVEGVHYFTTRVELLTKTPNQTRSFPEYQRLITSGGKLTMTLAFGYVKDPTDPRPMQDPDQGVREFRRFLDAFRAQWGQQLQESPVRAAEYRGAFKPEITIGSRFRGVLHNVPTEVKIVIAAGVDQMDIFAKSYAQDHDDVFAWFGHSRVGGGFDADRFRMMLQFYPNEYSITNDYQVVYWGGCNSYSYYTLPFFEMKALASQGRDPKGTKNLDIIANGLPSYFSLNSANAMATAQAFLNWPRAASYQQIIKQIENQSNAMGALVLVAVLGDEDNAPPQR